MKLSINPSGKTVFFIIPLFFIANMTTSAQPISEFLPKGIDGWETSGQDRYYYPETLYDYIDGGAELFISYGFNRVISRTYKMSGQPDIQVEIFDMVEPKNAFGVFSQGREQLDDTYGQGSLTYEGAILFWKGRYYVSVVCDFQTSIAKQGMEALAQKIDKKIKEKGELPEIISWLPESDLVPESVFYFHHYVWVNAFYFIADDNIFNIDERDDAVLAKYGPPDRRSYLLLIRYENGDEANDAHRNFLHHYAPELEGKTAVELEDGKWTGSRVEKELLICVFNGESEAAVESLINRTHSNYLSKEEI